MLSRSLLPTIHWVLLRVDIILPKLPKPSLQLFFRTVKATLIPLQGNLSRVRRNLMQPPRQCMDSDQMSLILTWYPPIDDSNFWSDVNVEIEFTIQVCRPHQQNTCLRHPFTPMWPLVCRTPNLVRGLVTDKPCQSAF